jgi:hypothetical protein
MKPSIRSSESDRILRCNGSLTLSRLVNARDSGPEAIMGVGVHWLGHDRMKRELGAVGEIGPRPAEMKAALNSQWIADYYFRTVQENTPADWPLELEADLDHEFDQFILTGHPDAVAMNAEATEAIGFDLKAGYIAVDIAELNIQVLCYCCLLWLAYPTLRKITYFIIQPRNDEDVGQQRVSQVVIDDVPQAVAYLESQINAAIANGHQLETSEHACKYCPAYLQCPAMIELREHMKHTLTSEEIARVTREPSDQLVADWYVDAKTLTNPVAEAIDLAKERIKKNGSIEASDGRRFGVKIEGGSYEYEMPAFYEAFKTVLPEESSIPKCWKPSKAKIIDEIAEIRGLKKTSKKEEVTATSIWDGHLRSFVTQGERVKIVELV